MNKHIRKLDTLIAAERSKILRRHGLTNDLIRYIQSNCQAFSNFVDSVCVGKFYILMSSRLLYPRKSRTPNFERFFLEKSAAYTRVLILTKSHTSF